MESCLSKFWWFWIPLFLVIIQALLEMLLPQDVLASLLSEQGPHELLQFIIIAAAFFLALRLLMLFNVKENPFLGIWVGIAALASLYVAGEELSWGQHVMQWSTPEYWHALNDQGETNFHNTSSWLDQKPRLVLEIGVIVGGLIIPLLLRFKPKLLPERFAIIYPAATLSFIAMIVLGLTVLDKVDEALQGVQLMERASEVEEIFLFYFVLLYLFDLRGRILKHKR